MSIINSKSLRPRELSFKSEKLEIDYITLNISMKGEIDPERIGRHLLVYGFNSTIQESEKDKARNFLSIEKNKHWSTLVKSKYNSKKGVFWIESNNTQPSRNRINFTNYSAYGDAASRIY